MVTEGDPKQSGWTVHRITHDGAGSFSFVSGNFTRAAELDNDSGAYGEFQDGSVRRSKRRSDALAVQVAAQGLEADLFISRRAYLHHAMLRQYASR